MDLVLLKWCLEKNPNFPVSLNSNLPTLKIVTSNYVVAGNLNVMHAARQTFIQNESSEEVKCALSHQIRTSGDDGYTTVTWCFIKEKIMNSDIVQE